MANNLMVKYIGPKKQMHVPFPLDNKLPLSSLSNLDEIVTFPRGQMVELVPERAEALIKRSPDVFKIVMPIKAAQTVKPKTAKPEDLDVKGTENPALQASESSDDHSADGTGV